MTTTVREQPLSFRILARIREAMEFRCFTVEDLAGATGIQAALLRRRFMEPGRLCMYELEAIAKACQVPVAFSWTSRRTTTRSLDVKPNSAPTR